MPKPNDGHRQRISPRSGGGLDSLGCILTLSSPSRSSRRGVFLLQLLLSTRYSFVAGSESAIWFASCHSHAASPRLGEPWVVEVSPARPAFRPKVIGTAVKRVHGRSFTNLCLGYFKVTQDRNSTGDYM